MQRRHLLRIILGAAASSLPAQDTHTFAPRLRIAAPDWGTSTPAELHTVTQSVLSFWASHFPRTTLPPLVILRGHHGPIVHYRANALGETVIQLDTQDRRWAQFIYQLAHELMHILCRHDDDWQGNLWFEESICTAASHHTLQRLGKTWATHPPHPAWQTYAPELAAYSAKILATTPPITDLAAWYRTHATALMQTPNNHHLNGQLARHLLPALTTTPELWHAIPALNSRPSPPHQPLSAYLHQWRIAAPPHTHTYIDALIRSLLP